MRAIGDDAGGVHGAHPHVQVHLDATNRRVDVIGEGIDIAIRVRPPPLQDRGCCAARRKAVA